MALQGRQLRYASFVKWQIRGWGAATGGSTSGRDLGGLEDVVVSDATLVQGRGVVVLPADVRRRLHLDQLGAQVEITEREDGVLELRSALPIPADQRWFWRTAGSSGKRKSTSMWRPDGLPFTTTAMPSCARATSVAADVGYLMGANIVPTSQTD
jgi:hypothetical protein